MMVEPPDFDIKALSNVLKNIKTFLYQKNSLSKLIGVHELGLNISY